MRVSAPDGPSKSSFRAEFSRVSHLFLLRRWYYIASYAFLPYATPTHWQLTSYNTEPLGNTEKMGRKSPSKREGKKMRWIDGIRHARENCKRGCQGAKVPSQACAQHQVGNLRRGSSHCFIREMKHLNTFWRQQRWETKSILVSVPLLCGCLAWLGIQECTRCHPVPQTSEFHCPMC